MGIGGNLMWAAVAREVYKKEKKPVLFIGKKKNIPNHSIWNNNPYICSNLKKDHIKLDISKKLPEKINDNKWIVDQHIIKSRCNHYNIINPEIKCNLFFSKEEEAKINDILKTLPERFIIIEPHAKTSWCKSKQYSLKKWQNIVNNIYKKIPVVQMSLPKKKILQNVINISDKINNFREACLLIKYANLFISTEGGLMHGANAVNTKSIIIFFPLFDPRYTKYDNVIDIWIKSDKHFNCFKTPICDECRKLMDDHNEQIIIDRINTFV